MKKLFSIAALLTFCAFAAFADRAKPGLWQTKKLADGTEVRVELCGDEFAHFWRTADGVRYVVRDGVLHPVTLQEIADKAQARRAQTVFSGGARRMAAMASGASRSAYVGSKKGIIILVEFSNKSFSMKDPQAYYHRMANEVGFKEGRQQGSVHDYFMEQSNGQFDLTFDVVGPVKVLRGYEYYGADEGGTQDANLGDMLRQAIAKVDNQVTWSDYDWDDDGEVEQIYYIYAGGGQATGAGDDTIWPHKWNLRYAKGGNGMPMEKQGVILDVYACSNELVGSNVAGIGTICHEFSHCLGLPDLYDTAGGSNYGMGSWDLMSSGNYNNSGYTPAGYSAWEKMMAGWLEPIELTSSALVTDMHPQSEGGDAYMVYNPGNRNEYYMIESRAKSGWDAYMPGEGMMIYHVDYHADIFHYYNAPNAFAYGNDHERFTMFAADNTRTSGSEATDLFPYGELNVLSSRSTPATRLHNPNVDGSMDMNIRINRIARAEDGTMSFVFGDLKEADPSVLFAESFDECNHTGANDGIWGTFRVATGEFITDVEGWDVVKAYGGRHCARVGNTAPKTPDEVYAVTPEIDFTGDCTLTFRAAPYTTEGTKTLTLSCDNPEVAFSQSSFTMESRKWGEFTISVTGSGAGKIKFSADCRLYLDDILLRDNTVTGIEDVPVYDAWGDSATDGIIYDMQGRRVSDTSVRGVYIRNGVKVVK